MHWLLKFESINFQTVSDAIPALAQDLFMRGISSRHQVNYHFDHHFSSAEVSFKHVSAGFVKISLNQNEEGFIFHWNWWLDDLETGRRSVAGGSRESSNVLKELTSDFYSLLEQIFACSTDILADSGRFFDWKNTLGVEKSKELFDLQDSHYPEFVSIASS